MFGNCYILPPTTTSFSAVFYSSPLATSVVTVTKKTPGVQALPETPPPNFGGSTSSRTPAPTKGNVAAETPAGVPPGGDSGESDSGNSAAGNGGMPSSGITDGSGLDFGSGSSSSGISGGGASSSSSTGSGAGSGSPASSSPSSSDSDSSGTSPAGGSGPGNSDSNTNSAGAGSAPGNFVAAGQPPITTTINHIQIIAGASTVQIGNQVVPISNSMQAPQTVVEDHQTFTIDASEVIGASTTLALTRAASEDATPTPVTVGSMTFSMDASEAIIGGTTFAVGFGAAPTTIVYQGTTISIGPEGVGIPSESTTIGGSETLPVSTTLPGGLDISVDASEVVISGTTYAIGAGAKSTTVVVGSDTLTMGPSGVGLQSTTIPPYTTSHATTATSKAVVATSTSTSGDNDTSSAATSNQSALRTVLSALLISVFVELRLV
ncbi:hypothetical protein UCRPC4_g02113 [Phaeomoniella chlamydospora]|uniref:Uncharacterized protein n=1 Tax=Phaeomoniella chlamydospora TaxID=158046 RepID=A0A0G2ESC1_PHACM|nr:hypothetical protein UCRPC4_g02113 [Phaeomoniella chlamydospora]